LGWSLGLRRRQVSSAGDGTDLATSPAALLHGDAAVPIDRRIGFMQRIMAQAMARRLVLSVGGAACSKR